MARDASANSAAVCRAASTRNCRRNAAFASLTLLMASLLCPPLVQSILYLLFDALLGRLVISLLGAQIILRHEMAGMVVRVLIALAVAEAFGAFVMRIA